MIFKHSDLKLELFIISSERAVVASADEDEFEEDDDDGPADFGEGLEGARVVVVLVPMPSAEGEALCSWASRTRGKRRRRKKLEQYSSRENIAKWRSVVANTRAGKKKKGEKENEDDEG